MNRNTFIAHLIAPALAATGFRFSKDYRWGTTSFHRAVYGLVDTISANRSADRIAAEAEAAESGREMLR